MELIYGLDAMKLVNEDEPGIKELLEGFCKVFGMEINESQCYPMQTSSGGEAEPADAGGRGTGADAERITRK